MQQRRHLNRRWAGQNLGPQLNTLPQRQYGYERSYRTEHVARGRKFHHEAGDGRRNHAAKHQSAYLMAVGGAAYLVARAIKGSKVVGFEDLGMEAIYEFEVKDMPVTVAVDANGENVHHLSPLVWREKIARERLLEGA